MTHTLKQKKKRPTFSLATNTAVKKPAGHTQNPAWAVAFSFLLTCTWKAAGRGAPAMPVGELDLVPDSEFQPEPMSAAEGIWGANNFIYSTFSF